MIKVFSYLLTIVAFNFLFMFSAEAKKVIAVLPFDVLSENVEYKQFGLGTTDTISAALTTIPDFVMIERNKLSFVMKEQGFQNSGFTDNTQSVKLGKILGAEILITGTIQAFEKQFRIVASFIDVESGKILKASKVTGNNIFDLQDKLASDIIENQKVNISEEKKQEVSKITKSTENMTSYSFYTTGKTFYFTFLDYAFANRKTDEKEIYNNLKTSIDYFSKAIELDNKYSLAYAAKSEAETSLVNFYFNSGKGFKDPELKLIFENAKKDAEKALELNPNLAQGYRAIAILNYYDKNMDKAIEFGKKAVELNPQDMESITWLSVAYYSKGNLEKDIDKRIEAFKNATVYNKSFTNAYKMLGALYLKKSMLKEAEVNFEKVYELYPDDKPNRENLKSLYNKIAEESFLNKNYDNAGFYYIKLTKIEPQNADYYSNAGVNYFMSKDYKKAEEMYQKAIELKNNNSSYYYNLAVLYETSKDLEKAKLFYKKACELGITQACGK